MKLEELGSHNAKQAGRKSKQGTGSNKKYGTSWALTSDRFFNILKERGPQTPAMHGRNDQTVPKGRGVCTRVASTGRNCVPSERWSTSDLSTAFGRATNGRETLDQERSLQTPLCFL